MKMDEFLAAYGRVLTYAGISVRQRSDGYLSMNDMLGVNPKKKINDYIRLKDTQEYFKALVEEDVEKQSLNEEISNAGIPAFQSDIIISFQGGNLPEYKSSRFC
jgi:hypothetical protein